MAKDPAFLFYPGDYLRDTQTLSEKTQVSYDRIMCEHMRNICISQKQLKFFTKRLNEDELEELMFVLTKTKGGFQIEWVAESIIKRKEYSKSRSDNRKGKGKKEDDISLSYDGHMENGNVIVNLDVIEFTKKIFNHLGLKYITGDPSTGSIEIEVFRWLKNQDAEYQTKNLENYLKFEDKKYLARSAPTIMAKLEGRKWEKPNGRMEIK